MLCGEGTLVNLGVNEGRAVTLKCRSWACENCQPDRQSQLIALAQSGEPTTFITLTSNPASPGDPYDRALALSEAWRQVVKRAKKHYGYQSIPYLCVFEATKKGEPHLHILCRVPWIHQRWLSIQMRDLVGAPIVDIRRVKSRKHIAYYVAKYVGKAPHQFGTCKRYWCTKDWETEPYEPDRPPPIPDGSWGNDSRSLDELENHWALAGWITRREGGMLYGDGMAAPF